MGYVRGLRCRACGAEFPAVQLAVCESCFGPLEVTYELSAVRDSFRRADLAGRPRDLWRYRELLPVLDESARVDLAVGCTPLRRAADLGEALEVREVWVKDDTVNPTYSFKDRPVAVAVAKAREWDLPAIGCASTGNLAAATAAAAAKAHLPCYVFAPASLEPAKLLVPRIFGATVVPIEGTYDDANRIALLTADRRGWGFVNINVRPYYAEGSKTLLFETWEQLGFELPDFIVVPMGSGLLLTSLEKGFRELRELGEVADPRAGGRRVHGAGGRDDGRDAEASPRGRSDRPGRAGRAPDHRERTQDAGRVARRVPAARCDPTEFRRGRCLSRRTPSWLGSFWPRRSPSRRAVNGRSRSTSKGPSAASSTWWRTATGRRSSGGSSRGTAR